MTHLFLRVMSTWICQLFTCYEAVDTVGSVLVQIPHLSPRCLLDMCLLPASMAALISPHQTTTPGGCEEPLLCPKRHCGFSLLSSMWSENPCVSNHNCWVVFLLFYASQMDFHIVRKVVPLLFKMSHATCIKENSSFDYKL